MSDITLVGVTKTFGDVTALDAISIDVADGELLCLLGPSGCGKTTLLRVVAGLERPDAGSILLGGTDVTHRPTRERPIGLVFQSYALFPNLTVRANIAFPLEVRGVPAADVRTRVDELLALVRLAPQADRYPNQISGGQAQRCALARALAPRPQVLLLDEPLSALDVVVRTHLRDEIRRIQQSVGTTTLYVTHDQSEALAIADRVAVMNHGRLEQLGGPRDIYAEPRTEFSAAFVGNRNAIEVPVRGGRAALGRIFEIDAPVGANGRVMSYFAPEAVQIRPADDRSDEHLTPADIAVVENVTFHGALTRLRLAADLDGRRVNVYAELPSQAAQRFDVGTKVLVRVDSGDVSAFPIPASD